MEHYCASCGHLAMLDRFTALCAGMHSRLVRTVRATARATRGHRSLRHGRKDDVGTMTWKEALAKLTEQPYGYGQASARGLLVIAETNGTYTDGDTVIQASLDSDGPTYRIGSM